MKRVTITFTVKGEIDVAGWENLTQDEQQKVFDEIKKLIELSAVVDENAVDW
jgi:hypothetical protein